MSEEQKSKLREFFYYELPHVEVRAATVSFEEARAMILGEFELLLDDKDRNDLTYDDWEKYYWDKYEDYLKWRKGE